MAIPLIYNVRSVRERWPSTLVAILGIAGVVAVFVAVLALAKGFHSAMVESGSPQNVMIRRAGSNSEMESAVTLDQVKAVSNAEEIAKNAAGAPLVSPEVVVIAAFKHRKSDADALAQVRGVSPMAMEVRPNLKLAEGRFLEPGLAELVVGKAASGMYVGFNLNSKIKFGGREWTVVGILDGRGSAYDSEVWADTTVLQQTFSRPENIFSSVTVRMTSREAFEALKDRITSDPRLTVQADRESDYYAKQSELLTFVILFLGVMVASIMAVGAIFGALNVLLSSVSARSREIATMRALGFSPLAVVLSMTFESLFVAFLGGILGCIVILPINGLTTSTINWQTFSQLAFAFRVTPELLVGGVLFALVMGFIGGLVPSVRAARLPVASALREL